MLRHSSVQVNPCAFLALTFAKWRTLMSKNETLADAEQGIETAGQFSAGYRIVISY